MHHQVLLFCVPRACPGRGHCRSPQISDLSEQNCAVRIEGCVVRIEGVVVKKCKTVVKSGKTVVKHFISGTYKLRLCCGSSRSSPRQSVSSLAMWWLGGTVCSSRPGCSSAFFPWCGSLGACKSGHMTASACLSGLVRSSTHHFLKSPFPVRQCEHCCRWTSCWYCSLECWRMHGVASGQQTRRNSLCSSQCEERRPWGLSGQ
jgi:hypothetical protein